MGQSDRICHMRSVPALLCSRAPASPYRLKLCAVWAGPADADLHTAARDSLLFEAQHNVHPAPLHAQRRVWQAELL